MLQNNRKVEVSLSYSDQTKTTGYILVKDFSTKERMRSCLILWLGSWIAAGLAVFLPLLHFILVPAFIIAGPVLGLTKYYQKSKVLEGSGTCPACQKNLKIVSGSLNWPLEELCSACGRKSKIEEKI